MKEINFEPETFFQSNKQAIEELLDFPSIEKYRYRCSAIVLPQISNWEDNDLNIIFDDAKKMFIVKFQGTSPSVYEISKILEKEIPFKIAGTSFCDCGEKLSLGEHSIKVKNNDFYFEANFYCNNCSKEIKKQKDGLKDFIKNWGFGISEIKLELDKENENWLTKSIYKKYDTLIENISKGNIKNVINQLQHYVFEIRDEELIALWATISCKFNEIEEDNIIGVIPSEERVLLKSKLLQSLCHLAFSLRQIEIEKSCI